MTGGPQDRAGVVSRAVLQIVTRELRAWADGDPNANIAAVRPEIETLLREEFSEIALQVRAEISLVD